MDLPYTGGKSHSSAKKLRVLSIERVTMMRQVPKGLSMLGVPHSHSSHHLPINGCIELGSSGFHRLELILACTIPIKLKICVFILHFALLSFRLINFLWNLTWRKFILSFKVEVTGCIWFNGLVPARLVTETRLLHNWAEKQLEDNSLSGFGATDPFMMFELKAATSV